MPGPSPSSTLPSPSPEEQAHSERLSQVIRSAMHDGAMSFAHFMELALYAPDLGYYAAGREKFGARGDYITAPELSALYARCLARPLSEALRAMPDGEVLEVGAGSGRLAGQLLAELDHLGTLPRRYCILDVSPHLRAVQAHTLQSLPPALRERVEWLDRLPQKFSGVVLGNEVLDAMPVERFGITARGAVELNVVWQDDRFGWREGRRRPDIDVRLAPLELPIGYTSEIGFTAEGWIRSVADMLEHGVMLLVDYGFPRAEFYHPQRAQGTLMCHYRHRAHSDPLILVGLQDITAHVDFTAVAEAGRECGLEVIGYTSQGAFLLGSGLAEILAESDPNDTRAHLALAHQAKQLTLPHEMGELFKVIALGRGVTPPLKGFALQDRRARL